MNHQLRQQSTELDQVSLFRESILGSLHAGVVVVDRDNVHRGIVLLMEEA